MSRLFYHTMQDNAGNLLFGVSGTMRLAGTGTLATIYGDEALTVILPNPMTNHPSFGSFKCFLGAGDYDFYMAKSGYTFETLTGLQGHGTMAQQDAGAVAITGGTAQLERVAINQGLDALKTLALTGDTYLGGGLIVSGLAELTSLAAANITNSGTQSAGSFVGVNTTPADYNLKVAGNAGIPGGAWINSTSSAQLKEAIAPLTDALATLLTLKGRTWRWRPEHADLAQTLGDAPIGLVVEEVEQVLPQWVTQGEDGRTGYAEYGALALVVEALREVVARVAAVEARADVGAATEALAARVQSLEEALGV